MAGREFDGSFSPGWVVLLLCMAILAAGAYGFWFSGHVRQGLRHLQPMNSRAPARTVQVLLDQIAVADLRTAQSGWAAVALQIVAGTLKVTLALAEGSSPPRSLRRSSRVESKSLSNAGASSQSIFMYAR